MMLLPRLASAGGCDLSEVVGYQLVQQKAIEGYIEDGKRRSGFEGCQPGRVIVFTDRTGIRCKEAIVRHLEEPVPKAYLFARSQTDIRMCAGDDIYEMAPAN
jgi:hypothetical protein